MKVLKIKTALPTSKKEKMISFLRANLCSKNGEYLHQNATKL